MYSKEFIKETKTLFYTSFGKFMKKNRSRLGKKVKWMNYPTKVKDIYIRLYADNKSASVFIDLQHSDEGIRLLFYDQFLELKKVFEQYNNSEWQWCKETCNDIGLPCSRIITSIENVSIYDKSTWKKIFQFYEDKLLNFDEFWIEFNEVFKQLED